MPTVNRLPPIDHLTTEVTAREKNAHCTTANDDDENYGGGHGHDHGRGDDDADNIEGDNSHTQVCTYIQ